MIGHLQTNGRKGQMNRTSASLSQWTSIGHKGLFLPETLTERPIGRIISGPARRYGAITYPVGTADGDDPMAVVDPELRVPRAYEGLACRGCLGDADTCRWQHRMPRTIMIAKEKLQI